MGAVGFFNVSGSSAGYTCARCQCWVPNGNTHSCTVTVPLYPTGYRCGSCGGWVVNGVGHTCWFGYGSPIVPRPCDHCFCRDSNANEAEPHKQCCQCWAKKAVRFLPREPIAAHLIPPITTGDDPGTIGTE